MFTALVLDDPLHHERGMVYKAFFQRIFISYLHFICPVHIYSAQGGQTNKILSPVCCLNRAF